ncbi:hypothetical protein JR316_0009131 [Psilocybe cubensis]|uniref:Uncharacterized protein n=1 Tax=Psilocybe cubensis TaxID=181762 RepID=A0ACB8GSQ0_PSICU|nr:hypothetical protein JR316_0009131 [Psilocybe cubensis]KAH9478673.1 hypothetical protein JR316_0009131 [Psilocybe cubensis]
MQRLPIPPPRRRTPSPPIGLARRPYDSYVPTRSDVPFRDSMSNVYRPNSYRPGDYSSANYYSRSPSPDAYGHANSSRISEPEPWDRGSGWRSVPEAHNMWPERKIIPASPTNITGRPLRDESTRLFEPSDSWKQSHNERSSRSHPSPPSDRYFDRRNRNSMDVSPERSMRNDRSAPFISGGDRYRPVPNKRETFPPGRSDYDSYRPTYEKYDGWTPPFRREPISPVGSHNRRDSGSVHARSSDRYDSPFSSRAVSRRTSPSPRTVISPTPPPHSNPNSIPLEVDTEPWTPHLQPPVRGEVPTRAPSRSSIASTQVSDHRSSPAPVVTPPIIAAQTSFGSETSKNRPPFVGEKILGIQAEAKPDPKGPQNAISEPSRVPPTAEAKPVPRLVSPTVQKSTASVPTIPQSNDVTTIKPSLSITHSPRQEPTTITARIVEKDAVTPANHPKPVTNGVTAPSHIASPSPPHAVEKTPPAVSVPLSPVIPEALHSPTTDFPDIEQPEPSYIHSPVLSPLISPADIHIPSPIHSPILSEPAAIEGPHSPVIQKIIPRPDEIPPITEAKSKEEAFRIVVMTRLLLDHQTREERVAPVLAANLAIANPPEAHPVATPESLLEWANNGQMRQDQLKSFVLTRPRLVQYLQQRNSVVEDKITRLKSKYVELQESWLAHCHALNEQQKTLASEHESQHGGRTTRRSTADAVRSDFEMEQIIASLGVDEATDPTHLSMRNVATIPDMISVTQGKVDYLFDDSSHLVENPSEYYAPHTGIHDWTDEEKQIFLDKFAAHPKQFGIIADYIPNKTAAQCVDFYYLHKKQKIDFRKVVSLFAPNKRKRRGMGRKKGNGLLVDIAKHDMEVNRGNVAAAVAAATPSVSTRAPRGRRPAVQPTEGRKSTRRSAVQFEDTPTSTPTPEPESRTRRRRGANAASSTSASAPTSAIASNVSTIPVPTPASTAAPTPRSVTPVQESPPKPATPPAAPPPKPATPPPPSPPPPAASPKPIAVPVPEPPPPPPIVTEPIIQPSRHFHPPPPPPLPVEREADSRPTKRVKRTRKIKSAATVSDDLSSPTLDVDKELPPTGTEGDSFRKKDKVAAPNQWSEEDKNQFLSLLAQYGDDFKRIAASMPNKTTIQVSNYYKINAVALDLQKVAARAPKRSPTPEHHEVWKELPHYPGSGVIHHVTTMKPVSSSVLLSATPPMSSLSGDPNRSSSSSYARDPARPGSPPRSAYPAMSSAHPYSDAHRTAYPGPTATTYPYPTDHRGVYISSRPPDSTFRGTSSTSSPTLSRSPYTTTYPASTSSASTTVTTSRPGYPATTSVGPAPPSIIHSPTGMSPPKPLPVQPMQSYPAHQSDPAHRAPYLTYPQPTHTSGYWTTQPYYLDPRASGAADASGRREHPYAMYPAMSGPPASGSRPPHGYPMTTPPGQPPAPGGRTAYYYPGTGWTSSG